MPSAVGCIKPDSKPMKSDVMCRIDIGFLTEYRRIYCHKFLGNLVRHGITYTSALECSLITVTFPFRSVGPRKTLMSY